MSRVKPADVRFYFDADVLGLAKVLVELRPDVTYPGDPGGIVHKRERPACPIEHPETNDDIWIPEVTSHGWMIITRDRHIQSNRREIDAVREHGARMITLVGSEAISTFAQLEIVLCRWRDIERRLEEPGPFIYAASRTSLREVALQPDA